MDVVKFVLDGKCRYEWSEVVSEHDGYKLHIQVFRDAMKFDNVPAMTWDFKPLPSLDKIFNGVRLPATAHQMQEIADLLNCMLLTPKVIDMIWLQAKLKFDSVVNVNGIIVANSNIHDVHQKIESKIQSLGGDDGTKLVSCEGKYWCLINDLLTKPKIKDEYTACNYGWCAKMASGPGITAGVSCWQRPGFRHYKNHYDPSQTIRLMYRLAKLVEPNGKEILVDLHDIASNEKLALLLHHQKGTLKYLRQMGVKQLNQLPNHSAPKITIKQGFLHKVSNILKKIGI